MVLLSKFYKERQIDYDQRLILERKGYGGSCLQSQGLDLQGIALPEEREKNLIRYRQEMQAFTDFLKDTYFQV
ncbi:MAG: hypothetical protein Q8R40_01320 [bacterium]|nr:hypothetical protein [bacterium]